MAWGVMSGGSRMQKLLPYLRAMSWFVTGAMWVHSQSGLFGVLAGEGDPLAILRRLLKSMSAILCARPCESKSGDAARMLYYGFTFGDRL